MKVSFGSVVISAGICGILSFAFLATSLGTEYWYIIEMNPMNMTDIEDMSSHSGLWSINEGKLEFTRCCASCSFCNPAAARVKLYTGFRCFFFCPNCYI